MFSSNETSIFQSGVPKVEDMSSKCLHMIRKGKLKHSLCDQKVTKLDPEGRYCSKHQVCTLIVTQKVQEVHIKENQKYGNFDTFQASLIFDLSQIEVAERLFGLK